MLDITIVGSGCKTCNKLEMMCREIVEENKFQADIKKESGISRFAELGVFMTPGLLFNGEVRHQGKLPTKATLQHWIEDAIKERE